MESSAKESYRRENTEGRTKYFFLPLCRSLSAASLRDIAQDQLPVTANIDRVRNVLEGEREEGVFCLAILSVFDGKGKAFPLQA